MENDGLQALPHAWKKCTRNLLMQTGDELTNLLRGLNGEYSPAPGGDLLRDGVLVRVEISMP